MSCQNERVEMFGVSIDVLDRNEAVSCCMKLLEEESACCRYIVTPNVDHVVKLQNDGAFMEAYHSAELVLADGNPVVWASRLLRTPLPETVTGSDLVPNLFAVAGKHGVRYRIFLLGAAPGVARRAAFNIELKYTTIEVVGEYSPPFGFHLNPVENDRIIDMINKSGADLLVIGLGAPKQELWIFSHRDRLQTPLAICAGATIDFMAEEKSRAPVWMQRLAMEWLYRMLSDPRRLLRRYLVDAALFPYYCLKEVFKVKGR